MIQEGPQIECQCLLSYSDDRAGNTNTSSFHSIHMKPHIYDTQWPPVGPDLRYQTDDHRYRERRDYVGPGLSRREYISISLLDSALVTVHSPPSCSSRRDSRYERWYLIHHPFNYLAT